MNAFIRDEDIAVVGLAGRFPGASSIEAFWDNLCMGKESITHFSKDELLEKGVNPDLVNHPQYVPSCGILGNVSQFDAHFFGLSSVDAALLDPQQRLFLLCAWEALESAGLTQKQAQASRVGVFASTGISHYLLHNILTNKEVLQHTDEYQLLLGNDKDFLATRVSYLLNLQGPSLTIQTGCSSSLAGIHYAVQSLLNGECDTAIAGGVSITIPQEQGYMYRKDMIGSPDGHCYAFDKRAEGTVKSNGVAMVVLKPLADALANRCPIYAVIKGSAVNNDGHQKVGYTAPNLMQQAEVVKEAMQMAEVDCESIGYIETHGTGTKLGDPIEIAALKKAFKSSQQANSCALASLKTNIGHLDVAAGAAGFIKACLAVYHGKIPASLHFSELNPTISLENSPFYVNTVLSDWPEKQTPKRAGISAFGVGGTNVHVVIEEAPSRDAVLMPSNPSYLFPFSAKSLTSLKQGVNDFIVFLTKSPHTNLQDMAYTLVHGRADFLFRTFVVANSIEDFIQKATSIDWTNIHSIDTNPSLKTTVVEITHNEHEQEKLGKVWQKGEAVLSLDKGNRIPLPTYHWDLKPYWVDGNKETFVKETTLLHLEELSVADCLKNAWEKTLGCVLESGNANFFDLGGHSLSAIHFIDQLPASLRKDLEVVHLYRYPKFNQFVAFVESIQKTPLEQEKKNSLDLEVELFARGEEL